MNYESLQAVYNLVTSDPLGFGILLGVLVFCGVVLIDDYMNL